MAHAHDLSLTTLKINGNNGHLRDQVITPLSRLIERARLGTQPRPHQLDQGVRMRIGLTIGAIPGEFGPAQVSVDSANDMLTWQSECLGNINDLKIPRRFYAEDPKSTELLFILREGKPLVSAALDQAHVSWPNKVQSSASLAQSASAGNVLKSFETWTFGLTACFGLGFLVARSKDAAMASVLLLGGIYTGQIVPLHTPALPWMISLIAGVIGILLTNQRIATWLLLIATFSIGALAGQHVPIEASIVSSFAIWVVLLVLSSSGIGLRFAITKVSKVQLRTLDLAGFTLIGMASSYALISQFVKS